MGLSWLSKRKLKKILKKVRQIELNEVNVYMDKIYNPQKIVSKPKYRWRESAEEEVATKRYLHMVYDPPLKGHKRDHTLDEYMEAKT